MQKIAILSDIHGNLLALENMVDDLQSRQVDGVVNLGDHVSGPLWPKETCKYLMGKDWIQISGNQDRKVIDQDPALHVLSNGHAFRQLDKARLEWLRGLLAGILILNPGSVGLPAYADDFPENHVMETGSSGRCTAADGAHPA